MASTFTVEYAQGTTGPGEITITIDATSETVTASGRLDEVGNRVTSPVVSFAGGDPIDVVVECIRTSSHTMRVVVMFNPQLYGGPASERVIEAVPIDFP